MSWIGRALRDSPVTRDVIRRYAEEARRKAPAPEPLSRFDRALLEDESYLQFLRGEISLDELLAEKRGYRLVERGRSGGAI